MITLFKIENTIVSKDCGIRNQARKQSIYEIFNNVLKILQDFLFLFN